MNESTLLLIMAGEAVLGCGLIGFCWWFRRELKKSRQDYQALLVQIQRCNEDLMGLCSAAVAVDHRLAANESRVQSVLESVNRPQTMDAIPEVVQTEEAHGYEQAIQAIRSGSDIEYLVRNCGLTRDEAMLLIRLHGSRN